MTRPSLDSRLLYFQFKNLTVYNAMNMKLNTMLMKINQKFWKI